ncbi:uncharacterized protein BJ171DRAFT_153361 [Polychytrium aggregatum]|uniref:uncharacterized protein n=1 Tax=Polychytrium aggregatum TaxID=110093 RepID=UPI0022FE8316|nr:uncharacterized protein BJ171DRAFT_153361 [Polychytrium aggregatum]KAI9203112.1 hypothetical protein BJ171DRAFT_153361 [Polychytrium aggregatum]
MGKEKKSKKHHRDSDGDDDSQDVQLKFGAQKISKDDFFKKSLEFRLWLKEAKKKFLNDLSSDDARYYFDKFVKRWNRGELIDKYYQGISAADVEYSEITNYKWKFKNINEDEQTLVRDSVGALTHSKTELVEAYKRKRDAPEEPSGDDRSSKRWGSKDTSTRTGANDIPVGQPRVRRGRDADDEEMDQEDRDRYSRALARKERSSDRKYHEMVMEELAPKATGREAMLEKRKAANAYHKRERDVDGEYNDADLMGGDSFAQKLAAMEHSKNRRQGQIQAQKDEKQHFMDDKVRAYKAKEDATIAMFREMAQHHKLGSN